MAVQAGGVDLLLRLATAVALAVVAFTHLDIADLYEAVGSPSLAATFRLQAAVAVLLAVALLVRPVVPVRLLVLAFSAASLGALVWSRYRCLYVPGFDSCFQETWQAPRAVSSAVAEAAALLLSAAGLALPTRRRVRTP